MGCKNKEGFIPPIFLERNNGETFLHGGKGGVEFGFYSGGDVFFLLEVTWWDRTLFLIINYKDI